MSSIWMVVSDAAVGGINRSVYVVQIRAQGTEELDTEQMTRGDLRWPRYVTVCLSEIRKEMQCPICLGIIRKTRTVMECLHRFCRECIDKSMRLGNNECPACRTHCASRRSLRDDPNFDALIAALYPDLDKYEEEEMALLEDETHRNKQIQASIAETFKRQSEAVARRRTTATVTAAAIVRKAHGKFRSVQRNRPPPRARSSRVRDSSFSESPCLQEEAMLPPRRPPVEHPTSSGEDNNLRECSRRKRRRPRIVEPESSDNEPLRGADKSEAEDCPEEQRHDGSRANHETPSGNMEGLVVTWARAGARSQTRYGSMIANNNSGRHVRCVRASALLDALTAAARKENEDEFDVQVHLQPLHGESDEEDSLPSLERPYLCCPPNMTVHHLCKFLVNRLSIAPGGELELLVERISGEVTDQVLPAKVASQRMHKLARGKAWAARPERGKIVEVLKSKFTMAYILCNCWDKRGNLDLLYRRKGY